MCTWWIRITSNNDNNNNSCIRILLPMMSMTIVIVIIIRIVMRSRIASVRPWRDTCISRPKRNRTGGFVTVGPPVPSWTMSLVGRPFVPPFRIFRIQQQIIIIRMVLLVPRGRDIRSKSIPHCVDPFPLIRTCTSRVSLRILYGARSTWRPRCIDPRATTTMYRTPPPHPTNALSMPLRKGLSSWIPMSYSNDPVTTTTTIITKWRLAPTKWTWVTTTNDRDSYLHAHTHQMCMYICVGTFINQWKKIINACIKLLIFEQHSWFNQW